MRERRNDTERKEYTLTLSCNHTVKRMLTSQEANIISNPGFDTTMRCITCRTERALKSVQRTSQ